MSFSQDKFRLLFEHSSDAHFIIQNDGITDCNNAAISLLNCTCRDEVLSLHPAMLSPEYQPDGVLSAVKSAEMDALARRNGFHRFEWFHRKKNGEIFPVEVTLNALEIEGRPALIAVWHDLTERKKNEDALRSANQKLKNDLAAAAEIQRSLLPVKSPLVRGLHTSWTFRPSEELGGDILNVFMLDEKNTGFYVLDAAGHGVAASLLSVSASQFLSPYSESSLLKSSGKISPPSEVARQLNRHFSSHPEAIQLFTLLYGILNRETLEFSYVCAGHPAPMLFSKNDARNLPGASGPPVGVMREAEYQDSVVKLKESDRVYLYSDGLVEARNNRGEQFGEKKLMSLLGSIAGSPLNESAEKIVSSVESWCSPRKPADDISLLAFGIVP